jgi:hypothetical protein
LSLEQLRERFTEDHFRLPGHQPGDPPPRIPSRATVGARLSGRGLDLLFAEAVVDVCSPDHRTAAPRLDQVRKLWEAAQSRPAVPPTAADEAGRSLHPELVRNQQHTIEVQDQLVRALEAKARSDHALVNSNQLVVVLLQMINGLQIRISDLRRRADALQDRIGERPQEHDRVITRLRTAQEQLRQAEVERDRAEEEQREALRLRDLAQRRAEELQQQLDRLRSATIEQDTPDDTLPAARLDAPEPDDAFLGDVAEALIKIRSVNDASEQLTREAREDLDITTSEAQRQNEDPDEAQGWRLYSETAADNPWTSNNTLDNTIMSGPGDGVRQSETDLSLAGRREAGKSALQTHRRPDPVDDDIAQALAQAAAVNDRDTPRRVISTDIPDKPNRHPSATDIAILRRRFQHAQQLGEAGDAAAAVEWLAALLPDQVRVEGPNHLDTLITRHELACWRGWAGDAGAVVEGLVALLPDQRRVLGPDHPRTLATRHNLAYWRGRAGDAAAAVEGLAALLPDQRRVLGPDHLDTLATRHELAYWRGWAGDAAAAVEGLAALLPDQKRVLGPDHPHTVNTRHTLEYWRSR